MNGQKRAFIAFIRAWRPKDLVLANKFDEDLKNLMVASALMSEKTKQTKKARR